MRNRMPMSNMPGRRHQRGITLMELLIVVTIIAIIASVSYPSYVQFVVRSKRTTGTSMLLQVADRQQQYFMDNKRYAANLTSLGFTENPIMIDDEGAVVASGDDGRVYQVALTNTSATTYTLSAVPQLRQAAKDTACGTLTLTHTGVKGQSGNGGNCW